jgi:hypothetical protein
MFLEDIVPALRSSIASTREISSPVRAALRWLRAIGEHHCTSQPEMVGALIR